MFMVINQQDCYENENSKKVLLEEHAEKKSLDGTVAIFTQNLGYSYQSVLTT